MKYKLNYTLGQLKFDIKIQLEDILRLRSTGEDNDETRLAERSREINDIIGKLYLKPSETKKKKSKSKYDKNRIKDILKEDELKTMEKYIFSFEAGNNKLFKAYWGNRKKTAVSYTHLTLPTTSIECRSRWSPYQRITVYLSLIHISEPTRLTALSRMPSSA